MVEVIIIANFLKIRTVPKNKKMPEPRVVTAPNTIEIPIS